MDDFVREAHERLAALEQANGALERRLVDHHKLAQRLQTESGMYNGKLEAVSAIVTRLEERLRVAEAGQIAREIRLKILEDAELSRNATSLAAQKWGRIVVTALGLIIAGAGLLTGLMWPRK